MKFGKTLIFMVIGLCFSHLSAEDYTPQQKEELGQKALHEMLQKIFSESMKAKRAFLESQTREDPISNFATTAPRSEFIVNADISSELATGTESAKVYVKELERFIEAKISSISTSPERKDTILIENPF